MLRAVLPAWTAEPIGTAPTSPSYVADDGFPAEMSVNWSGRHPELRLLFDCFGDDHTVVSPVSPGDTGRLRRIHEIFTLQAGRPSAAPLWHSVAWRAPARVVHKTYFGLYEWPLPQRYAAVAEAMAQLGMAAAWDDARSRIENADGTREIEFFAVDRADQAEARVKIYYRNHGAGIDEMNRIASVASRHDAEAALAAYRTLAGVRTDAGEAALSCLAFRSGLDQVAESTSYLRLADLASSDREAVDRTAALLRGEGVDPGRLHALAAALSPVPLEHSRGLLNLVSYRAAGRRADITTYFRFPVYEQPAPHPVRTVDVVSRDREEPIVSDQDVERIARHNEQRQREYESSDLIRLLAGENTATETKRAVLTYLQPWSNAFQRMISARVTFETDPDLRLLALEHQQEEVGHDAILARSRAGDQRLVWDPIIEAGASWFVDQFAVLPGVQRAVLAHLALEAGSLVLSQAGTRAFPDDPYFTLHDEADAEHLEMGYRLLRQRSDWAADDLITLLDRAWQVIGVVSDRIAECARRDTLVATA
ncbi:hypothetical protein KIPE111705_45060 [Kibdelosporangium persicum]|uniref:Uncharacterized protein n=1 Tax=Kibdelosporangium persicum TaxID=2698649 RepID=A0ABX2F154_9PSEU|nr:hypothetical protein [Kibdelosporangium persicum]NRN65048.1 hypothetical protein [Kibdelosporangium persicum]